jgi:hypothetical protein
MAFFEESSVELHDSVPITEITLHGDGNIRLELYVDRVRIISTEPCRLMRGPPHRLTLNYPPSIVTRTTPERHGIYAKLEDLSREEVLWEDSDRFSTIGEAVEKLEPLLMELCERGLRSQEWIVSGEKMAIAFLNVRTVSHVEIYNRAFTPRSLSLGSAYRLLNLPPYGRRAMGTGPLSYRLPLEPTPLQRELNQIFPPPPLTKARDDSLVSGGLSYVECPVRTEMDHLERTLTECAKEAKSWGCSDDRVPLKSVFVYAAILAREVKLLELLLVDARVNWEAVIAELPLTVVRLRQIGVNEKLLSSLPGYEQEELSTIV